MEPVKELFSRMVESFDRGDFQDARAAGEQLLSEISAHGGGDERARAGIHCLVANAILSTPRVAEPDLQIACSHLRQALAGALPSGERLEAALALGQALTKTRHRDNAVFQEALNAFQVVLDLLAGEPNGEKGVAAHFGIAEAYERLGPDNLEAAEEALTEYRAAYECIDAKASPLNRAIVAYNVGRVLLQIAAVSRDAARREQAVPFLKEAQVTYTAAGLDAEAADASDLLRQSGPTGAPKTEQGGESQRSGRGGDQPSTDAPLFEEMPADLRSQTMTMIRSAAQRPGLLRNWIDMHHSADAERLDFLRRFVVEPAASEVDVARWDAEKRGDAKLRERAEQMARDLVDYAKMLIDRDKKNSTHQRALGILRAHLEGGPGFLLFLRNFDLEVVKGQGPKWLAGEHPVGAKVKYVNVLQSGLDEKLGRFADAFPVDLPIVAISDIGDVLAEKPGRIAKLRILSNEWDLVAAMLIGEAAAIVIFIDSISGGTKKELELVAELSAAGKTSALLTNKGLNAFDRAILGIRDDSASQLAFQVLPEAVYKTLGEQLVQVVNFPADQDATRIVVDTVLKRMGAGRSSAPDAYRTSRNE
jgi:hypothetical protein